MDFAIRDPIIIETITTTNFGTEVQWWDDEGQDIVWCCDAHHATNHRRGGGKSSALFNRPLWHDHFLLL